MTFSGSNVFVLFYYSQTLLRFKIKTSAYIVGQILNLTTDIINFMKRKLDHKAFVYDFIYSIVYKTDVV